MSDLNIVYREQAISYNEASNTWKCELFSRDAGSLASAKERIDNKLDAEKKEPFKRFKAYVSYARGSKTPWPLVEVTGLTDDKKEAWIVCEGVREKIGGRYRGSCLKKSNPKNDAIIKEMHAISNQIEELRTKYSDLESSLEKLEIT